MCHQRLFCELEIKNRTHNFQQSKMLIWWWQILLHSKKWNFKLANNQQCKTKYVPEYVLNDYLWVYDGGGGAIYDSVS